MMRLLDLLRKKLCNQEAVKKPEPTTTTSGGGGLSGKEYADGGGGGKDGGYGGYAGKPDCIIWATPPVTDVEIKGNDVTVKLPKGTAEVKLSWDDPVDWALVVHTEDSTEIKITKVSDNTPGGGPGLAYPMGGGKKSKPHFYGAGDSPNGGGADGRSKTWRHEFNGNIGG